MGHGQEPEVPDAQAAGDYSYDLAHEAGGFAVSSAGAGHEEHKPVYVANESTDSGQDYSYDLAHDIPRVPRDDH
jgi:hypothetical protein